MTTDRVKLRSRLGAARRWGDEAEAAEIKSQLVLLSIEDKIRTQLDGQPPLSIEHAEQLCALIETYSARLSEIVAPVEVIH